MEKRKFKLAKAGDYVPSGMKSLSCCPNCRLILDESQWRDLKRACPNCGAKDIETRDFSGMISLIMPNDSWVAKWNGLDENMPGVYAIAIQNDAQTEREEMQERQLEYGEENVQDFIVSDGEY